MINQSGALYLKYLSNTPVSICCLQLHSRWLAMQYVSFCSFECLLPNGVLHLIAGMLAGRKFNEFSERMMSRQSNMQFMDIMEVTIGQTLFLPKLPYKLFHFCQTFPLYGQSRVARSLFSPHTERREQSAATRH